jgi:radical SAM superfamily enzyme YgiQ (UPF0313 family)
MKSVSFVQVNYPANFAENKYYLPYSIGLLWAYLDSFKENEFTLDKIIFKRDPISTTAKELSKNTVVAFSCYLWDRNYCLSLAEKVKKLNPDIKIVFGGPELEVSDISFFKKFPFIDVHVINEGEITFKNVLDNINSLDQVPGIIWNDQGKLTVNKAATRIDNLDNIPSPYLTGVFDKLIASNPNLEWSATIETNRGCPYQCTFCDWGSLTYSKIRKFNLERVLSEIKWVFDNKNVTTIDLADANFGIFTERDSQIVNAIIEQKNTTGKKISFTTNFAKNQNKTVVEMVKKLAKNTDSSDYHVVSLQSLNENVLSAIKRKNLAVNKIQEIYDIAIENDLTLKVELILGLPEDTLETYKKTIFDLYEISPEISIQAYRLQALNNSELFLTSQDTVWKPIKNYNSESEEDVDEYISYVYSTKTLPYGDLLEALCFTSWIIAFHIYGFSNVLAKEARDKGISYESFYNGLYARCIKDKYINKYFEDFKKNQTEWYNNEESTIEEVRGIKFNAHKSMWHFISKIHGDEAFTHIFKILKEYSKEIKIYSDELFDLQQVVPISFNNQSAYPLTLRYNNKDFKVINKHKITHDHKQFINDLYYKREIGWGKAIVKEDTSVT